jgi:hypothetical protein
MIGGLDDMQRCARAQVGADGAQQFQIGEGVAGSLQKKHRNRNFREVIGAFCSRTIGRMKRKSKKH